MERDRRRSLWTAAALGRLVLAGTTPLRAERVSVRLNLRTYSAAEGDLQTWLQSYNSLWTSFNSKNGGTLLGSFQPPALGSSWEIEVRFPLFAGLALDLAGTTVSGAKDGTVQFQNPGATHTESDFLLNDVKATPIRIGLSFTLPVWNNLRLSAGYGRHLVFARYRVEENYEAVFKGPKMDYRYWFKKATTYRSESLGSYATFGAEYLVLPFLAVGIEAEKDWTRISGFKGSFTYSDHTGKTDSGSYSLYFFESDEFGLDQPTQLLIGRTDRPAGDLYRNVRQGEFDFSGFSLKIGLRFLF
ncbi:MAG: hypothetical protein MUQ00_12495 [Candidatus Aminicenantes bacterium]|nr:hypothetical protein [Candidatus Aminicenantes bacterium]